jgi:hypothetical protein
MKDWIKSSETAYLILIWNAPKRRTRIFLCVVPVRGYGQAPTVIRIIWNPVDMQRYFRQWRSRSVSHFPLHSVVYQRIKWKSELRARPKAFAWSKQLVVSGTAARKCGGSRLRDGESVEQFMIDSFCSAVGLIRYRVVKSNTPLAVETSVGFISIGL